MASRADNIASNLSLANFSKATELRQRIWFTIGALIVFRFLSFVPLPGVNPLVLQSLADTARGGILDIYASAGTLERAAAGPRGWVERELIGPIRLDYLGDQIESISLSISSGSHFSIRTTVWPR